MPYVTALLFLVARLVVPSRGLHAAPLALRAELRAEARARRASRVRRYLRPLPASPAGPGFDPVPAPAVPSAHVPVVDPRAVDVPAAIVRGYYRDFERRQAQARTIRTQEAAA